MDDDVSEICPEPGCRSVYPAGTAHPCPAEGAPSADQLVALVARAALAWQDAKRRYDDAPHGMDEERDAEADWFDAERALLAALDALRAAGSP